MKIAVIGLWHLGIVTAACLAKAGHDVIGYDPDQDIINNLQKNIAPIFEPGLDDLIQAGCESKKLHFTWDVNAIHQADVVWVNFDTPVDDNDIADIAFVENAIEQIAPYCQQHTLFLISSQLPIGTTRKIQQRITTQLPEKNIRFGYIPENLRLGKAISVFTQADRFVVGLDNPQDQDIIKRLLGTFTEQFVWMSIESAEMTKHALNAFLALSVTFINEIATLCENTGADAREVEAGLKSEERIGKKAYLRPGGAIAGGTLLRDINYLNAIGEKQNHPVPLISAILHSNVYHKNWVHRKILSLLQQLKNKTVAILGLTYTVNTSTLRRSSSVETCQWLHDQGVKVNAFDPMIQTLPAHYSTFINLKTSLQEALQTADAVIVATEWPDFRKLAADTLVEAANQPLVVDPNGFLMATLGKDSRIRYCSVGKTQ
jgi:UDPglucose 6-dehydrogenase